MSARQSEEAVFAAAVKCRDDERAAYLDRACAGDAELRQRLEARLAMHHQAPTAAEEPAVPARPPNPTIRLKFEPEVEVLRRIGRYKLLQKIGEGGCGVVYMAEQEEPVRRRVALKVIKPGMDTKQVLARFEAERQALALMDHPNIAKVFDGGATENGRPFFVMELVKGVRITEYCDENKLSTQDRLALFTQVCQAIQHAHQKSIIHRDIKPSNILVADHDGVPVPKVIDFGIAKATTGQPLTDRTVFTAFEQFIGTPAYMSPEQAEVSSLEIDKRSDIYSLGVLLYELLTGNTPFGTKRLLKAGLDEIRRIIREEDPPRPSTKISTLDDKEQIDMARRRQSEPLKLIHLIRGDLDWIAMKCLEKNRTRRYESATELATDVRNYLANKPVLARPPSKIYRLQKFVRRQKLALAGGTALVFAAGLGIAVGVWQSVRATRTASGARTGEIIRPQMGSAVNQPGGTVAQETTNQAPRAEVDRDDGSWNLTITKTTPAAIQVDVFGVAPLEKSFWASVNPSAYWRPNSVLRKDAIPKLNITFSSGPEWRIEKNNPAWSNWVSHGATELMIIADLPGSFDDGPSDGRRIFLPLDKRAWQAQTTTVQVEIRDSFIRVLTPQTPIANDPPTKLKNDSAAQAGTNGATQKLELKFLTTMEAARAALARKEYKGAMRLADEALKIRPQDYSAKKLMGEAEAEMIRAIERETNYMRAMTLGKMEMERKNYASARIQAQEALKLKPGDPTATQLQADSETQLAADTPENKRKYQTAIRAATDAIEDKEYTAAIAIAEAALKIKPGDTNATKLMAQAQEAIDLASAQNLFNQGDYLKSSELCKKHAGLEAFESLLKRVNDEQEALDAAAQKFSVGYYTFIEPLKGQSYVSKSPFAELINKAGAEKKLLGVLQSLRQSNKWQDVEARLAEPTAASFKSKPPFRELADWVTDQAREFATKGGGETLAYLDNELEKMLAMFQVKRSNLRPLASNVGRVQALGVIGKQQRDSFLIMVKSLREKYKQGGWLNQNDRDKDLMSLEKAILVYGASD